MARTLPPQYRMRQALAATAEWHGARTVSALILLALPALAALLGVDATGWNAVDATGEFSLFTSPLDAPFLSDLDVLERLLAQHPSWSAIGLGVAAPVFTWSDTVSRVDMRRRELYQDFMRPNGIANQMSFVLGEDPLVVVVANSERSDFTERQRDLLELVRPHLSVAYDRAREAEQTDRTIAALDEGLLEQVGAAVLLDERARIAYRSPAAAEILHRWFAARGDRLPPALANLRGERMFRRPDATLLVRSAQGRAPLLLIEERRTAPDPERVRRLGLTPRQVEAVLLAARGLPDRAIGGELGISVRTVNKHLANAYERLGVHDRAAAADRLLRGADPLR
jgi:DNA-binding CsgD family transcriptional regulator